MTTAKTITTMASLILAGLVCAVAANPAEAQYYGYGGYSGYGGYGGYGYSYYAPAPIYVPAPACIAPAPVMMAPAPVYCAPVYRPPVQVYYGSVYHRSYGPSYGCGGRSVHYGPQPSRGFSFGFGFRH